jgi:hypothetical protein
MSFLTDPAFAAANLFLGGICGVAGYCLKASARSASSTATLIANTPVSDANEVADSLAETRRQTGADASRYVQFVGTSFTPFPVMAGIGLPQEPRLVVKTRDTHSEVLREWKWRPAKRSVGAGDSADSARGGDRGGRGGSSANDEGRWEEKTVDRSLSVNENGGDLYVWARAGFETGGGWKLFGQSNSEDGRPVRLNLGRRLPEKMWVSSHEKYEPAAGGQTVNVYGSWGGRRSSGPGGRSRPPETIAFRSKQEVVPLGRKIFVQGEVTLEDGEADEGGGITSGLVIKRPAGGEYFGGDPNRPFVLSYGSKKDVIRQELAEASRDDVAGTICYGLALGFGVAGVVGVVNTSGRSSPE